MESVEQWAAGKGFGYRFVGDEILDRVPDWYRERAGHRWPVMTDLGRLELIREALEEGYERAVWLDADVLVFDPAGFSLGGVEGYAFGRELWVQRDDKGKLRVYRNIHNAVCVFDAGNPMLAFYIDACLRIVGRLEGGVPNQIVGTKLLTALHNMIGFPLVEDVAMFSPLVVEDIAAGGGAALDRLKAEAQGPIHAANMCASLAGAEVPVECLEAACSSLLETGRV